MTEKIFKQLPLDNLIEDLESFEDTLKELWNIITQVLKTNFLPSVNNSLTKPKVQKRVIAASDINTRSCGQDVDEKIKTAEIVIQAHDRRLYPSISF